MPHITLPCSVCGETTDWACASCRMPTCYRCLRDWPAASGKPGATRGYRCVSCEAGLREEVKLPRSEPPLVSRIHTCTTCGAVILRSIQRRWTHETKRGLSDEEKVRLLLVWHRECAHCAGRGLACSYSYGYAPDWARRASAEWETEEQEERNT